MSWVCVRRFVQFAHPGVFSNFNKSSTHSSSVLLQSLNSCIPRTFLAFVVSNLAKSPSLLAFGSADSHPFGKRDLRSGWD